MDCNVKMTTKDVEKMEFRAHGLNRGIETKLQEILLSIVRQTTISDLLDKQTQAEEETLEKLNSELTELGMECTYASFPAIIPPPNITRAYEEAVCTRMLRQAKLESATELQQSNLAQLKRDNDFRLEQTELLTESYRKALEGISGTLKKEEAVKAAEA